MKQNEDYVPKNAYFTPEELERSKEEVLEEVKETLEKHENIASEENKESEKETIEIDIQTKLGLLKLICSLLDQADFLSDYHKILFKTQLKRASADGATGSKWPIEVIIHALTIKLMSSESVYNTAIRGQLKMTETKSGFVDSIQKSIGIIFPSWRTLQSYTLQSKYKQGVLYDILNIALDAMDFKETTEKKNANKKRKQTTKETTNKKKSSKSSRQKKKKNEMLDEIMLKEDAIMTESGGAEFNEDKNSLEEILVKYDGKNPLYRNFEFQKGKKSIFAAKFLVDIHFSNKNSFNFEHFYQVIEEETTFYYLKKECIGEIFWKENTSL